MLTWLDSQEWVGFLQVRGGNSSRQGINRAVLVATPIYPDSNASIKDKRPKYFTAKKGDRDFLLPPRVSVNTIMHD